MSLTNFPNGVTSFGIPLVGGGSVPTDVGGYYFVDPVGGSDGNDGLSPQTALLTIVEAVDKCVSGNGDVVLLFPGSYNETVTVNKSNMMIVGLGGRGSVFNEPSTAGAEAFQVTVDDVTFINVGCDGDDTSSYALNLNAVSRFRAFGCKFELGSGTGPAVLLDGTATDQCADILFRDCEFAWAGSGILADDSAYGYVTQVFLDNCRFHNLTTVGIGVAASGLWKNLEVTDCVFDNLEDGTAPTDYVLLSDNANTGIFSGNRFATATNATGVLTIGSGLLWVANGTEAGFSTARPS